MKISYNWLRDYLDIDLESERLSELLTNCGLEVEGMEYYESVKGGLEGVVVGEVKECREHPNADKLSLTKVDTGSGELLPIVCGAPNVAEGQKVLVARVGTTLYMDDKPFEIKKAKIRGEVSEGMICAEDELGLGDSHEGIMVLDDNCRVGAPATDYFPVYRDVIFEIGLTPNRTDAMSHIGVARDIAAVLNTGTHERKTLSRPDVKEFRADADDVKIELKVEVPGLCPRFSGVSLTGIKVGDSPRWLKDRLNAVGIRPINNVVDVTNFVLMEMGQPLHAYDIEKIDGRKVVVRTAYKGEKFVTLDGVERILSPGDLMICDESKGMCIAGVFGGAGSGVTKATTAIYLESAHFNPVSIRKTSRLHNLQTDASFRFERGSDPNITVYALKRAALLIKDLAEGAINSDLNDFYPEPVPYLEIELKYAHVDRLIGKVIDRNTIKTILEDLEIKVLGQTGNGLRLSVPPFKWDVTREADVIEEIIRVYGFNKVEMPERLRSSLSFVEPPERDRIRNVAAELLSSNGYREIMTNSLTSSRFARKSQDLDVSHNVEMMNPLSSDLDVLRQSLVFGGLEVIEFNQNRRATDLKLYEMGKTYRRTGGDNRGMDVTRRFSEEEILAMFMCGRFHPESWKYPGSYSDIYDLKAFVSNLFDRWGIDAGKLGMEDVRNDLLDNGLIMKHSGVSFALIGTVASRWLKEFDIKEKVHYAEISLDRVMELVEENRIRYLGLPRYPEVRRDLALLLPKDVSFARVRETAFRYGDKLLKSVNLFDVYEGDKIAGDKKSYAVSFILQDPDKTLTDKVIEHTMDKLMKAFEKELGAAIRS